MFTIQNSQSHFSYAMRLYYLDLIMNCPIHYSSYPLEWADAISYFVAMILQIAENQRQMKKIVDEMDDESKERNKEIKFEI